MALIPCHECGAQISSGAATCPQCGARTHAGRSRSGLLVGALALVAVSIIGYVAYYNSDSARDARRGDEALYTLTHSDEAVLRNYSISLGLDSAVASDIPVKAASAVTGCEHLFHLETTGDIMDRSQADREIRLRSQARHRQPDANAIVMTTPASWPARVSGEVYQCPK